MSRSGIYLVEGKSARERLAITLLMPWPRNERPLTPLAPMGAVSTPKSRPNNMGQMSVRPSVHPQKVFPIPMKFGMQVEVDELCTKVCRMT